MEELLSECQMKYSTEDRVLGSATAKGIIDR